ncbi:amidohydrolase family protein [Enterococcus sp. LJL90]
MEIFDSHFHIIDPKFPIIENNGFTPDFYTVENYRSQLHKMGIHSIGGVVVSGSFQGYDQTYFADALTKLGPNFLGVSQLPSNITDYELTRLNTIGIRGIRFNLYRGITENLTEIEYFSKKVFDLLGWHTEFYLNLDTSTTELDNLILSLPKASVDHIGMGRNSEEKLKKFISNGIPIRVTGFGRVEYSFKEISLLLPRLYAENPSGLLFGTDLPSTRSRKKFSLTDIELLKNIFSEIELENLLVNNGKRWYLAN